MAHTITFSRLHLSCRSRTTSSISDGGIALNTSIFKGRSPFARKEIKTQGIQIHNHRKLAQVFTSTSETHPTPRSSSPGERAMQLYECINEKNFKALDEIISEDCCFEDFSFPTPFKGKKVSCVLVSGRIRCSTLCSLRCLDKSHTIVDNSLVSINQ